MYATCPACNTAIVGSIRPVECPACGYDLTSVKKTNQAVENNHQEQDATLFLHTPDGLIEEIPVGAVASIGRGKDNKITVSDREVSKKHAIVEKSGDEYILRDLGSSNGTFVNGRRISSLPLVHGDEITAGTTKIHFRTIGKQENISGFNAGSGNVSVLQSHSCSEVIASMKPRLLTDADDFGPAEDIGSIENLRADYERLRVAYRFHQEGGLITGRDGLFRLILKLALEWLPADNGVVLVPDGKGDFNPVDAESRRGDSEIAVSSTILYQVNLAGEGVLSSDAITDKRFASSDSLIGRGVRSVLAVPVVTRDTIRAIVYLESMSRANAFTPKDLDILTSITGQAGVAMLNAELMERIRKEEATRSHLERFLSPALVHKAASGELDINKGGSLVTATILFSDIRGFTAMSERLPPEEIVRMLNEHFEDMVDVVFNFQGVLDKFLGDSVMAIWGVPVAGSDDADRAVRAALEMQKRVKLFNESQQSKGKPVIGVGIGCSTGECIVGNMGSSRRLEYTAIGDTVNLASRLCSLAGPGDIVLSENTGKSLKRDYKLIALPPKQLKGIARPVPLFRIDSANFNSGGSELSGLDKHDETAVSVVYSGSSSGGEDSK